jgi:hypothetical protein
MKVRHTVTNLDVQVPFISSLPVDQTIDVLPKIAAVINGSAFAVEGKARPFSARRETSLDLRLEAIDLVRYLPYVPVRLPVAIQSALLDAEIDLVFSQPPNEKADVRLEGKAAVSKLKVQDLERAPLIALERVSLEAMELVPLDQRVRVKGVTFDGVEVWIERRTEAGGFFESVLREIPRAAKGAGAGKPGDSPAKPAKPWTWAVDSTAVRGAKVYLKDAGLVPANLPKPLDIALAPIDFTLGPIGSEAKTPAPYLLDAKLGTGESVKLEGAMSIAPFSVNGRASLSKLDLRSWWWAIQPHVHLEAVSGLLEAGIGFAFTDSASAAPLVLSGARLGLTGLELRQGWDQRTLVSLKSLALDASVIDLAGRSLVVDAMEARDARLLVERERDGRINLARLVKTQAREQGPASDAGGSAPWRVDVKRLLVDQSRVRVRDVSARGEADLDIDGLRVLATDLSTRALASAKERGRVDLAAKVGKAGSIKVSGPIGLEPLGGQLDIDIQGFPLLVAQPYFTQYVNALVSSGGVSTRGRLSVEPSGIGFRGSASIAEFASVTKAANEDLLKWKSLSIDDLNVRAAPFALAIRDVTLTDFYSRLIISPQGRFNLQDVLVSSEAAPATAPSSSAASPASPSAVPAAVAEPAPINIDRIALINGNIDFTDLLIRPNYSANLTQMNGAVTGLSPTTPGALELRGRIDNAGSVEVLGRINPLAKDLFLDAKAKARDIDLPRLTPYAHKYVGYGIEKGKLSVNLSYFIEKRQVKAENNIILDQLTFGDKIESPTATKLPVLFAISLLKDRNGVIDISLPVSGSLDDPQFSVAGIVWKLIGNLIVKAVTSPFTLLASLAGGSSAELSNIEFAQGSSALSEASRARLQTLGKALADRPGLKLDLSGRIDPQRDAQALERLALLRLVKAQKLKQTVKAGADAGAIDAIEVTPEEYPRYLAQAYRASDSPKPRNALGQVREASVLEMEALLLASIRVDESALRNLANERAQRAKEYLIEQSKIEGERLFVVAPRLTPEGLKAGSSPMQVEMSLK